MQSEIARHRTAIGRGGSLSRPVRLAVELDLLKDESSFFDYGCGRGEDLEILRSLGFDCSGWDPVHKPESRLQSAQVVNIGYVINVIEDQEERKDAIRGAWDLAQGILLVSARMSYENKPEAYAEYRDGCITSRSTFQKYFLQTELHGWIEDSLGAVAVPISLGVFAVFRDPTRREDFVASRFRRRSTPRLRLSDKLFAEHRDLLDGLTAFYEEHGRLPEAGEWQCDSDIKEHFGSSKRAFQVVRRITGPDRWEAVRNDREDDLLIHLALAKFRKRPRMSDLSLTMQRDIRGLFGSYKTACEIADGLLMSVGDMDLINRLCGSSEIGKKTPNALYLHVDEIPSLAPALRVYEGCARAYYGMIDDANIVKLHRFKPKVSYLSYPGFEKIAHPVLTGTFVISLGSYQVRYRDYVESSNPPILHRKETMIAPGHPLYERFAKLTAQEERRGLLDDTSHIGTKNGWEDTLEQHKVQIKGHRVMRSEPLTPEIVTDHPPPHS